MSILIKITVCIHLHCTFSIKKYDIFIWRHPSNICVWIFKRQQQQQARISRYQIAAWICVCVCVLDVLEAVDITTRYTEWRRPILFVLQSTMHCVRTQFRAINEYFIEIVWNTGQMPLSNCNSSLTASANLFHWRKKNSNRKKEK